MVQIPTGFSRYLPIRPSNCCRLIDSPGSSPFGPKVVTKNQTTHQSLLEAFDKIGDTTFLGDSLDCTQRPFAKFGFRHSIQGLTTGLRNGTEFYFLCPSSRSSLQPRDSLFRLSILKDILWDNCLAERI